VKSFKIFFSVLAGLFLTVSCGSGPKSAGKISDVDGNVYSTVKIGPQTWMAENLKTTKYNDGTPIPNVTDTTWNGLKTGAYCWYGNDSTANKVTYGALYNWHTVHTGKLCPTGWHVPTDKEWRALTDYLGTELVAGNNLKAATGWSKNGNGIDKSGFSGLPGGYRTNKGAFNARGGNAYWWSSSPSGENAWYCVLFSGDATANKYYTRPQSGFSVRCIKN
jgi:uncharacterized protein (TIGR02145 family)